MNLKPIMTLLILSSLTLLSKTGNASWYGAKFQGKLTASGEPFDMYAYTAAHKTLPFDTLLTVTNLQNRKSVNVRVNDRGPFVKNRIIDLSYQAAKKIGLIYSGVARVNVQILNRNPYLTDKQEAYMKEYGVLERKRTTKKSKSRRKSTKRTSKKVNLYRPSNVKKAQVQKQITTRKVSRKSSHLKVQIAAFRSKRNAYRMMNREKRYGNKMTVVSKYVPSKRKRFYKVVILCNSKRSARNIMNSKRYRGAYLIR